ncbi:MAG: FkbM family methyltransferase [Gemmatales bacterium]|nr:FkbM family methyltransferase [Gemmatales bacterium]
MRIASLFERPEYVFRPLQVVRRIAAEMKRPRAQEFVRLPWGVLLEFVGTDRWIGRALRTVGIDDLPLCEMVWRLVSPGDFCVDVGANVGLITTLMAVRVGPTGRVLAFEPHPATFEILARNVARMTRSTLSDLYGTVELRRAAVGEVAGKAFVVEAEPWQCNTGCVRIVGEGAQGTNKKANDTMVEMVSLGDVLRGYPVVDLLKIDVEGHQNAVIKGAWEHLKEHRIRHIVYEISEQAELSGEVLADLRKLGYRAWIIDRTFFGPKLRDATPDAPMVRGHPTNLLVTRDPGAAETAAKGRGWRCLGWKV